MSRKFFVWTQAQFQEMLLLPHSAHPELERGASFGWAWDGVEAWTASVLRGYRPDTFWVAVRSAHGPWHSYPAPARAADVEPLLQALCPTVSFRWKAGSCSKHLSYPWPNIVRTFASTRSSRTFFAYLPGYLPGQNCIYIGATARLDSRLGRLRAISSPSLKLLGVCGRPLASVRARFERAGPREDGWFRATPRALKTVAKLCSLHIRKQLQRGRIHAAASKGTTYRASYYARRRAHILQYQRERYAKAKLAKSTS